MPNKSLLYQGTTSQLAEKLSSFEGAQLQLCHKNCKISPALAAEGRFFLRRGLFPQAVQSCRKTGAQRLPCCRRPAIAFVQVTERIRPTSATAFEEWLNTKGVENIENVNKALKAAHSWYDKVNVPALV